MVTYNCAKENHSDCTGDHDGVPMQLGMAWTGKLQPKKGKKKKRLSLSPRVANLLHNNMILNHHTENFYTSMSVIPNCAGVYKVS